MSNGSEQIFVDLEKAAFKRYGRTISYREFSKDIANMSAFLENVLPPSTPIVSIASDTAHYAHWVVSFACLLRGRATLRLRKNQTPPADTVLLSFTDSSNVAGAIVVSLSVLRGPAEAEPGAAFMAVLKVVTDYPERPHRLILTTGTTGTPKAVMLTNSVVLARLASAVSRGLLTPDDKCITAVGLDTVAGYLTPLGALWRNAMVIIHRSGIGGDEAVVEAFNASTHVTITSASLYQVLKQFPSVQFQNKHTRVVTAVGGHMEPKIAALALEYFCNEIRVTYGSTEAWGACRKTILGEPSEPHFAGKVYEDAEVKIESDCGVELPAGQSGIIAVRTSQMVTSYWTQDAPDIFRDGWFYPGDIGYLTENNELYVEGRVDARLNYEGQKILATSLESELCEVDGVDDAFVTVCPRPNTREDCLVAMIASELDSSALRRLASPILSPRRFRLIVVPRVPRNHMGKLERGPLTAYCEQQIQKAADA